MPEPQRPVFAGWWVVIVAMIGLSTGTAPFVFSSFGLFLKEFAIEFDWNRAEIGSAATLLTLSLALSLPIAGRLIDRYGARAIILPSMLVVASCLAAIPLLVSELWHLVMIFVIIGCMGGGTNTAAYMPIIAAWFDRQRGLAMGFAMAGMGLGFVYVPPLVQSMIDNFGWRYGYYVLSAIILLISLPLTLVGLRNNPADIGLQPDGRNAEDDVPQSSRAEVGLSVRQVVRTPEFRLMIVIFVMISFTLNGILHSMVPMLTDRSISGTQAALVQSTMGLAVLVGRILVGFLIDHYFAPHIATGLFFLSAVGLAMFAFGAIGGPAFIAAILVGLSLGAELDFMAFLSSRYFGLLAFGTVSGLLLAFALGGTALAPFIFGLWFEGSGSYVGILSVSAIANVLAALLMLRLGPYPDWKTS